MFIESQQRVGSFLLHSNDYYLHRHTTKKIKIPLFVVAAAKAIDVIVSSSLYFFCIRAAIVPLLLSSVTMITILAGCRLRSLGSLESL